MGPIVQLVSSPPADPGVMSSIPARSYTFMGIDYEVISTVILLLPLIQEMTRESMCRKNVVRSTDHLYMTIAVDWDVKNPNQTNKIENYLKFMFN